MLGSSITVWVSGGCRTGLIDSCDIDIMCSVDTVVAIPLDSVHTAAKTKRAKLILGICTTDDVHRGCTRLIPVSTTQTVI